MTNTKLFISNLINVNKQLNTILGGFKRLGDIKLVNDITKKLIDNPKCGDIIQKLSDELDISTMKIEFYKSAKLFSESDNEKEYIANYTLKELNKIIK